MADGVERLQVVVEGSLERCLLEAMHSRGWLPTGIEAAKRKGADGQDAVVRDVAARIAANIPSIAILDHDEGPIETRFQWAADTIGRHLRESDATLAGHACELGAADPSYPAVRRVVVAGRRPTAIVIAGLPARQPPIAYPKSSWTMDDFVEALAMDREVYDALADGERHPVAFDHVETKMRKVLALLEENGIPVTHAKRFCVVLRGLADYAASQPTFAFDLVRRGAPERVRPHLAPLLDDLAHAHDLLSRG